jgi:hypothetical protein
VLVGLAERLSRTEPDIPSIRTPLLHETEIETEIHAQHTRELTDHPPALITHHELEHRNHDYALAMRDAISGAPDRDSQPVRVSRYGAAVSQRVIAVLGPQPDGADKARPAWEHAAGAIEQYRADYQVAADEPLLLGPAPPAGAFQQRYERRQAAAAVLEALDRLDRPGFHRGPINEHANSLDVAHEQPDREPTIGRDL